MSEVTRPPIVFCFPYHGSGGVPVQFLRMSSALADRGWSVSVLDYEDGTMAKNLRDPRVQLRKYSKSGSESVGENEILVLQTMTPWSIFPGLRVSSGTRTLFWTFHPFNLVPTVPVLSRLIQHGPRLGPVVFRSLMPAHRRKLKRFFRMLLRTESVVFMDIGTATNTSVFLDESIKDPVFVPIVAPEIPSAEPIATRADQNKLRVGWVGRIADFKYPILSHTLRRLDEVATTLGHPIEVSIVGTGDYLPALRADALAWKNISVRFLGEKRPHDVLDFMRTELDLSLAMGTSALEAASCGVPSILLDFSYGRVPEGYRFRWLHEQIGHSLGEFIENKHLGSGDDGLFRMVHDALHRPHELREKAQQYVRANHSIEMVTDRLETALNRVELTWGDLLSGRFLRRGLLYSSYQWLKRKTTRKELL